MCIWVSVCECLCVSDTTQHKQLGMLLGPCWGGGRSWEKRGPEGSAVMVSPHKQGSWKGWRFTYLEKASLIPKLPQLDDSSTTRRVPLTSSPTGLFLRWMLITVRHTEVMQIGERHFNLYFIGIPQVGCLSTFLVHFLFVEETEWLKFELDSSVFNEPTLWATYRWWELTLVHRCEKKSTKPCWLSSCPFFRR